MQERLIEAGYRSDKDYFLGYSRFGVEKVGWGGHLGAGRGGVLSGPAEILQNVSTVTKLSDILHKIEVFTEDGEILYNPGNTEQPNISLYFPTLRFTVDMSESLARRRWNEVKFFFKNLTEYGVESVEVEVTDKALFTNRVLLGNSNHNF